jgi:NAD+ kinase
VKIDRLAIVAHAGKPEAKELQAKLTEFAVRRGAEVVDGDPDLVMALGGDGTMLRSAQMAHSCDAPLLGVNLGALGYLTEVEMGDECDALQRVLDGDFDIEERMMLQCESSDGGEAHVGLNELLVERSSRRRFVRLLVSIGGEQLGAFNADGVIVATPTGSTAYAMSAGGPLVDPRAQCLVLVPVSPHMIFSRPFVLPPDMVIEITIDRGGQEASLAIDGHIGWDLAAGGRVVVRRHPRPLRLVRLSGPGFVERLRSKLGLPG